MDQWDQTTLRRIETNDETLKRLKIVSERQLRRFVTAVPDSSNIQDLTILGGAAGVIVIDPEIASSLSAIFTRMPFLDKFYMINCDCSNADALSILASGLANKASLDSIWLRSCRIGSGGAEIIASSFGDNTTLKKLFLDGNSIGDKGAIALAPLFSSRSSIKNVSLKNCSIGSEGMSALAAVLYNDESIESVMSSNHTLGTINPQSSELQSLLQLNAYGPKHAMQRKIIRFINEQPTFFLATGMKVNVIPFYIQKIGRMMPTYMGQIGGYCRLNTAFEVIRNVPDVFKVHPRSPEKQSRDRSRC